MLVYTPAIVLKINLSDIGKMLREEVLNSEVHRTDEYVDFPPALERPQEKAAIEGEQG